MRNHSSHPSRRSRARRLIGLGAALAGLGALTLAGSDTVSASPRMGGHPHQIAGNVVANLFEWNWKSVANECTTVLGPKGYAAVQVAPPQDSLSRTATDSTPVLHPWWEVYQPVDYNLTSRMGNEAQFKSMVATCRKAGVKVYVDAIINHMTGQGNLSYGGVSYSKFEYQGLYTSANFHHT
ncbi:MAG: alpha-amylase family glycosyl hydrolase, partial [Jatrophihabitantaceae bacterium]